MIEPDLEWAFIDGSYIKAHQHMKNAQDQWITMNQKQAMFPDHWEADKIKSEIKHAFENSRLVIKNNGKEMWEGDGRSGMS